ncbi:MAG: hypothetical protein JXR05_04145 [Flavobacteriaceae bacterium]
MTKFFKSIRKSVISEGNTTKYFKYAIGEILLVVIGILIALQVSNWNQSSKQKKKELNFLIQIDQDLANILSDMETDYRSLRIGERSHFRINNYITTDITYKDSMCFDFYWLIKDEYIYPITSTYDAIKEEGLAIIQNDSIRQGIQAAFENIFPRISKQNPFYPDLEGFFSPFYQTNFKINQDSTLVMREELPNYTLKYPYIKVINGEKHFVTVGYVPQNFQKLKRNDKFQVLMRQAYTYRAYKIDKYRRGRNFIKDLQRKIKEELNNRK